MQPEQLSAVSSPPMPVAAAAGGLFAIGTDAHAPGQLDWLSSGCAREPGIGPERVIQARGANAVTARR